MQFTVGLGTGEDEPHSLELVIYGKCLVREIEWKHKGEMSNPEVISKWCPKGQVQLRLPDSKNEMEQCSRLGNNTHKIKTLENTKWDVARGEAGEISRTRAWRELVLLHWNLLLDLSSGRWALDRCFPVLWYLSYYRTLFLWQGLSWEWDSSSLCPLV